MSFQRYSSKILVVTIAISSVISNYKFFRTSKFQTLLFNNNDIHQTALESNHFFYPSLVFNGVPYETYLSEHYSNIRKFDKAIELLNNSLKKNKYCLYTRYQLSRNYILKKDYLKAEAILDELFKINPNIESTSALYFSLLGEMNKKEKLISLKPVVEKVASELILEFYYSALNRSN